MKASVIVDDFRVQQNDLVSPYRYRDALVLIWFNDGIREIYARRPEAYEAIVYEDDIITELTDISAGADDFPFVDYFKRAMVIHLLRRAAEHDGDYRKSQNLDVMFRTEITGR